MITVNLLKEHHGVRARLLADGDLAEKKSGVPVLKLLAFFAFFLIITAGFLYGKRLFFSYVEELDSASSVQEEEFFNEEIKSMAQEELFLELMTPKNGEEEAKTQTLQVATEKESESEGVQPVHIEKTKEPLAFEVAPGENYFLIRVATLVVEQNAKRLSKRLTDMGMPVSIKKDSIEMPSYQLFFEAVPLSSSEIVTVILKEMDLSFDVMRRGDGVEISSNDVFVKSFAYKVMKSIQMAGVEGKVIKGRKETDIYKVILGKYFDKEKMLKDFEKLKRNDFSPIFFHLTE